MSILAHPQYPGRHGAAILAGFPTGSAALPADCMGWLDHFVLQPVRHHSQVWIHLRGFASHLGEATNNQALSQQRANAVAAFLLRDGAMRPERITGIAAVGEDWADGAARDDSARWRSVELIMNRAAPPTPPPPVVPHRISRMTRCSLVSMPSMRTMPEPGDRVFEQMQRFRESGNARQRLHITRADVMSDQRVTVIEIGRLEFETAQISGSAPFLEFTWARDAGEFVTVRSGGRERSISRAYAARIFNNPLSVLGSMEDNPYSRRPGMTPGEVNLRQLNALIEFASALAG
ncbi:MAG TPA: OmpA family protein [Casimicrobium sp.]|jgi:hypothetical protein|nr:OmpA family protein [Casimicrobium sp.]